MSLDELRVPDGTECGDTTTSHPIDDLLRQLLIGDDANSLGLEFTNKAVSKLNHVRFAMRASIYQIR